jgi:hypothetical protein
MRTALIVTIIAALGLSGCMGSSEINRLTLPDGTLQVMATSQPNTLGASVITGVYHEVKDAKGHIVDVPLGIAPGSDPRMAVITAAAGTAGGIIGGSIGARIGGISTNTNSGTIIDIRNTSTGGSVINK